MAQLGIMIEGQEGLTWERWRNLIDATENLGFESLWRSDHLFSVMGETQRETLALWPSLTMVATQSTRIRFGQLVSPITFRHPVTLAQNAAALDHLSGGRFEFGIGAGWNEAEHAAFGFPLPPARQRLEMLDEALQAIQLLWTGDPVTFSGRHYQLQDAQMRPTPSQPGKMPLVIGGKRGKRLLQLIAAYADEWNITGGVSREEYQEMQDTFNRFCADAKRDPRSIRRSIMMGHLVGRDRAELLYRAERLKHIVPTLRDVPTSQVPDRLRERGWLVGQPDEVITGIKAWEDVGIERFMLQTLDQEDLGALEPIAQEVMPAVTEAAARYATGPGNGAA